MRTLLTAIIASLMAVWIGVSIAQEEYLVASLSAGVSVWMVLAWARGPLTETWLIGFLLFGYIVGNRGFAQITPMASLPVFFGEVGLGVGLTLLAFRSATPRTSAAAKRIELADLALDRGRDRADLVGCAVLRVPRNP